MAKKHSKTLKQRSRRPSVTSLSEQNIARSKVRFQERISFIRKRSVGAKPQPGPGTEGEARVVVLPIESDPKPDDGNLIEERAFQSDEDPGQGPLLPPSPQPSSQSTSPPNYDNFLAEEAGRKEALVSGEEASGSDRKGRF